MKVIMHLAVSSDGYIAKKDGDSGWVSKVDEELFVERVQQAGAVVIGHRTYQQYKGVIYPIPFAINMVLCQQLTAAENGVIFVYSPEEAMAHAKQSGTHGLVVAGGAKTADSFLKAGLVDDVYQSVHPLKIGEGIKMPELPVRYKLVGERHLPDAVLERHFAMI